MRCTIFSIISICSMTLSPTLRCTSEIRVGITVPTHPFLYDQIRCAKCDRENAFIKQQFATFITSAMTAVFCADEPEVQNQALKQCAGAVVALFQYGWNS